MTDATLLNTATVSPRSGNPARQLVILLHGYGSNAQDLIGLAPSLAPEFPECAFVSPDAPFACEMGYGRQWFGLSDRSAPAMKAGLARALPILQSYIDEQQQRWNVTDRFTALVGFSQGTMMALAAGPRRDKPVGGMIGYSGALLDADSLPADLKSKPPVLLVHGDRDEIVPFAAQAHAASTLRAAGVAVETLARPGLGHGIDAEGLGAGIAFLHQIWG